MAVDHVNQRMLEGKIIERHFDELQKNVSVTLEISRNVERSIMQHAEQLFNLVADGTLSEKDRKAILEAAVSLKEAAAQFHQLEPGPEELQKMEAERAKIAENMRQTEEHEEKTKNLSIQSKLLNSLQEIGEIMQNAGCSFDRDGEISSKPSIAAQIKNDVEQSR